jgi:CubicO group peptidase (beta-lactamase class C family)
MKKSTSSIIAALILLVLAISGYVLHSADDTLLIGTGHTAKYLCSKTFLSGQDPEEVFKAELEPSNMLFSVVGTEVDYEIRAVTSRAFGFLAPSTAIYREGFGCTLTTGTSRGELLEQAKGALPQPDPDMESEWPIGEKIDLSAIPREVDQQKLQGVLERAFREPRADSMRNTHAIVVVYKDRIIAEKYADHLTRTTPLLGWSMTKSWTNALVGILVKDGKLDILQPAPVDAWRGEDDPRQQITLDQLLRMSSGLEFSEIYGPGSDAVSMFYISSSTADYAASKSLRTEPDGEWYYSSGTTNIIARIVRDTVGGSLVEVNNFARNRLFDRLGMSSAIIEPDPSGSFVGSSYGFATASDWARFGVLIKNDGVWQGERILPENWVEYSTTPTPLALQGQYGAQFWLNAGSREDPANRTFPSLPRDLIYQGGFNGQIVAVIPSRDVVFVRLGVTLDDSWDDNVIIREVLDCIAQ